MINTAKPDIIIATETWLDYSVGNAELESEAYSIYRRDRKSDKYWGVLIAVNSSITSTEVNIKCEAEIL